MDNLDSVEQKDQMTDGEIHTVHNPSRWVIIGIIAFTLAILAGLAYLVITLSGQSADATARVRDIFIILMALEFLVIGVALVVLIIQLASLINMLQNEVKPILNSTRETVANLKGTTKFLSDNMVEPVIKLNEYLAGIKKLVDMINIFK